MRRAATSGRSEGDGNSSGDYRSRRNYKLHSRFLHTGFGGTGVRRGATGLAEPCNGVLRLCSLSLQISAHRFRLLEAMLELYTCNQYLTFELL
jgi:hypothetical protein